MFLQMIFFFSSTHKKQQLHNQTMTMMLENLMTRNLMLNLCQLYLALRRLEPRTSTCPRRCCSHRRGDSLRACRTRHHTRTELQSPQCGQTRTRCHSRSQGCTDIESLQQERDKT